MYNLPSELITAGRYPVTLLDNDLKEQHSKTRHDGQDLSQPSSPLKVTSPGNKSKDDALY